MTSRPTQLQLATLLATLNLAALEQAITDAQPGQPGGTNYNPRTTSGQGPADPTADAAANPSPAKTHLAQFQRQRDALHAALTGLAWLQNAYIPNHEPRRQTIIAETKGCTWHDQAGITEHQTVWRTSDCGFLAKPVPLCRACYDFAHRTGERPTVEQIVRHHRTGKWVQRTSGKRAAVFTVANVTDHGLGKPA